MEVVREWDLKYMPTLEVSEQDAKYEIILTGKRNKKS
jgi:hypothetical protein